MNSLIFVTVLCSVALFATCEGAPAARFTPFVDYAESQQSLDEAQRRFNNLFGKPIDMNQWLKNQYGKAQSTQPDAKSLLDLVNRLNRITSSLPGNAPGNFNLEDAAMIEAFVQMPEKAQKQHFLRSILNGVVGGAVSGATASLTNRLTDTLIDRYG